MTSTERWQIETRTMTELRRAADRQRRADRFIEAMNARTKAMTMDSMVRRRYITKQEEKHYA